MAFNTSNAKEILQKKKNRRPIFCGIAIHRLCNSVADTKHSKNLYRRQSETILRKAEIIYREAGTSRRRSIIDFTLEDEETPTVLASLRLIIKINVEV
jgi:hypothetical protein